MACTKPLSTPLAQTSRRIVTVVFTDLVGSTALGERLDPEVLRDLLDRYFDVMRSCLEYHGGTIEKYIGDAIMAVFGIPRAREDDALRAVRAAHEMGRALEDLNEELLSSWNVNLANRTGVYTGEVVAGDPVTGQRLVTGDAVNTAARLEQAASTNEVLVGEPTYRLIRHAGTFEAAAPIQAKGKAEPVRAYRVVSIEAAPSIPRRLHSEIIGRRSELDALDAALLSSMEQQRCGFALVSGDPGVGKTRLVAEFVDDWSDRLSIMQGRCLAYGEDAPFWSIADPVRNLAGIGLGQAAEEAVSRLEALCEGLPDAEAISARLLSAMGLSAASFAAEEVYWALRRLIEHLASSRPLLLVMDDLQWANAQVLDAISHVVSFFSTNAGALILGTARPEFMELEMAWIAAVASAPVLDLDPLSAVEAEQLVTDLLGHGRLPRDVLIAIEAKAQGNPLFIEQIIAMWRDEGILDGGGARMNISGPTDAFVIPSSIRALLMARLDGLARAERDVLERGSIVGEVFQQEAITALAPEAHGAETERSLPNLQTKRFIRPDASLLDGESWAFVHVLVRDAVYEGMLKRTRVGLHTRFADWLESRSEEQTGDSEEIAFHLEQAFRLGAELGSEDKAAEQLGRRAASLLERCANRSRVRMLDLVTSSFFERAARCVPVGSMERPRLLSLAAEAAWHAGDLVRFAALLPEVASAGTVMDDATRTRVDLAQLADPQSGGSSEERFEKTDRIIDAARRRGDVEGLAWALRLRAQYAGWLGNMHAARRASLEGVAAARRAGRRDLEIDSLAALAMDAIFDDSPIGETVEACLDALTRRGDDISFEMALSRPLAVLTSMQGNVLDAGRYLSRYRELVQKLGETPHRRIMVCETGAMVAMIDRDPARLERELRPAYELLTTMQDTTLLCSYSALLAHACANQGRFAEAIALSEESEALSSEDDYDAQSRWRSARGLALAGEGRFSEAAALAEQALTVASATDDLTLQGDALLDLAQIAMRAGDVDRARRNLDEAIVRFERKGNLASAQRARKMMPLR